LHASSKYPPDITEVRKNGYHLFFNFELSALSYELNCFELSAMSLIVIAAGSRSHTIIFLPLSFELSAMSLIAPSLD